MSLENIGNFIKAITKYGVKPHDIFEANDLFENTNHTQVQSTLLALASMAKTKGNKVNVRVKYAEKQEQRFEPEKLREGRNIIGLQKMESDISQAFQEELTCFICLGYFTDPVTISCGHSFCQACLHLSWEDMEVPVHCPMCREPSLQKDFRTNTVLKKLVSIARQASLKKSLSANDHKCDIHKETKRIFCVENKIYLCKLCSESHEHCAHTHCAIETAGESQMEKLLIKMASIWEKMEENQQNLEEEDSMITQFRDYLTQREDMISTEYQKWYPVPFDEEKQHIEKMKNEGQCALEKLRERISLMLLKSMELRDIYEEMMVLSQKPYVELLQGFEDILQRSESMRISMPQNMKPELSALPITGLTERFQSFQGERQQ
ncbi:tripartite motif-containing protein 43-like isoform X2 [Cricetulus griseus]|uniref:Tripartite motif-containing protein 43-like isoform X2 n=2 Tax=Cricetulus griseus TaxID=10029 RepID=A0A9J7FV75_CRIGR|nr:tripartite motif-containing protein 43-like isoform X2 [Cricetulus griseus]